MIDISFHVTGISIKVNTPLEGEYCDENIHMVTLYLQSLIPNMTEYQWNQDLNQDCSFTQGQGHE